MGAAADGSTCRVRVGSHRLRRCRGTREASSRSSRIRLGTIDPNTRGGNCYSFRSTCSSLSGGNLYTLSVRLGFGDVQELAFSGGILGRTLSGQRVVIADSDSRVIFASSFWLAAGRLRTRSVFSFGFAFTFLVGRDALVQRLLLSCRKVLGVLVLAIRPFLAESLVVKRTVYLLFVFLRIPVFSFPFWLSGSTHRWGRQGIRSGFRCCHGCGGCGDCFGFLSLLGLRFRLSISSSCLRGRESWLDVFGKLLI